MTLIGRSMPPSTLIHNNRRTHTLSLAQISSPTTDPTPLVDNLPGHRLAAANELELSSPSEHASKANQVIDIVMAALEGDFEEETLDYRLITYMCSLAFI
ncbi:hypothetical protein FRB95_006359 [Tulasnella sp. JGI-2019a]|nr:hypothetical protein FRB95_006359 [Tulasnella sp. JGI-2019a]